MNKRKNAELGSSVSVTEQELALINSYTRKELSADEVYTFSVVLCDNDIDRDFEYFTKQTLEELAQMFVGVTGIYDHNPTAQNQVARIYSCAVEQLPEKKTAYGEDYARLVGKAYIPICSSSSELIDMLDSGIRKEVSVGCGIGECVCSVCGEDMRVHCCSHIKGEEYDGVLCCGILKNATDAYEWSFTPVPSQRRAGVLKSFFDCEENDFEKSFPKYSDCSGGCTLNREEYSALKEYISELKRKADENGRYKSVLELETVKEGVTARIGIESDLLEKMVKCLSVDELLMLRKSFERKSAQLLPIRTQLAGSLNTGSALSVSQDNKEYEI